MRVFEIRQLDEPNPIIEEAELPYELQFLKTSEGLCLNICAIDENDKLYCPTKYKKLKIKGQVIDKATIFSVILKGQNSGVFSLNEQQCGPCLYKLLDYFFSARIKV